MKADFDAVFDTPNTLRLQSTRSKETSASRIDVLLHPSAIRTAPPLPSSSPEDPTSTPVPDQPLDAYVQDVLTVPASLAGLPCISVPAGTARPEDGGDRWPVGVSVVGQWGQDPVVLLVAEVIESAVKVIEDRYWNSIDSRLSESVSSDAES